MFGPVISFLVYLYFYEKPLFPPGIDKAFKATAQPSIQELTIGEHIFLRQGIRFSPGVAKKLVVPEESTYAAEKEQRKRKKRKTRKKNRDNRAGTAPERV